MITVSKYTMEVLIHIEYKINTRRKNEFEAHLNKLRKSGAKSGGSGRSGRGMSGDSNPPFHLISLRTSFPGRSKTSSLSVFGMRGRKHDMTTRRADMRRRSRRRRRGRGGRRRGGGGRRGRCRIAVATLIQMLRRKFVLLLCSSLVNCLYGGWDQFFTAGNPASSSQFHHVPKQELGSWSEVCVFG